MKRTLILMLLCLCCGPALAGPVGSQQQSLYPVQMRQQIAQSMSNARRLYDTLAGFHHNHLDPQATLACYDLLQQKPSSPYLKAAFAYSWFRTAVPLSMDYVDYQKPSPVQQAALALNHQAERCRREAVQEAPASPEVLLETGVTECNMMPTTPENRTRGTARLRKVVELAPTWSDGWYWLGKCLETYAIDFYAYQKKGDNVDAVTQKLAREEIAAYKKAEKLNPGWHTDCLLGYVFAYGWLKEPQKQHEYLEAYIKINPWVLKGPGVPEWRKQISDEAGRKTTSAGV